jgi:methionyl-tRNA formyltransferase
MGVIGLQTILSQKIKVHLVITHKNDPKEKVWFDSVSLLCEKESINYIYAEDYTIAEINKHIDLFDVSVIFSFYFRTLLPTTLLRKSRFGAVNMHGSLLPKYRGRAPVNWQIINGEKKGGVTLHYMDDKPDAGNIIDQIEVKILVEDTPVTLFEKLINASETILSRSLPSILNGTCKSIPQNHNEATSYRGRKPEDGLIDWTWSSETILNLVRGVTKPYPGAFSYIDDDKVIIWKVYISELGEKYKNIQPGAIILIENQVHVRTGTGHIKLVEIQIKNEVLWESDLPKLFQSHDIFFSN